MASSLLSLSLLLLVAISISDAIPTPNRLGGGGRVGGKTEIPNVATNKEVQDLGRFSVEEHNKSILQANPSAAVLSFVRVVEAQSQVVNGIKYFLGIAATDGQGQAAMFDAQVVVPPGIYTQQVLNKELSHLSKVLYYFRYGRVPHDLNTYDEDLTIDINI